jgi:chloramphenicol O-acetyltransferase
MELRTACDEQLLVYFEEKVIYFPIFAEVFSLNVLATEELVQVFSALEKITVAKLSQIINDEWSILEGRLIVEIGPLLRFEEFSIATVIIENIDDSTIVFANDFSISCFLKDSCNICSPKLPIFVRIFCKHFS